MMEGVTEPVLVPRRFPVGLAVTWAFAGVVAIAIGIFVAPADRFGWFAVGAGVALLVAFAAELRLGRAEGFISRVAAAAVGGVGIMGVVSAIFALAAIVPG